MFFWRQFLKTRLAPMAAGAILPLEPSRSLKLEQHLAAQSDRTANKNNWLTARNLFPNAGV
jgi:hypothetical protein